MSGHALVVRNGVVVDGTGLAAYPADVGIDDGVITEIGRISARGDVEIDADGHAVTPGFIDGHTHLDAQVFWDELGSCVCWHGVTTAVMGHCGFTLAPASRADRALVLQNLERAEDISGEAMAAGIDWSWTTFDEYLDAVDGQPKGINYAANVGHSALRTFAMGERAFTEHSTEDDQAIMARELRRALAAGAIGFTTSRSRNHLTPDDHPVASRLADWSELARLVGELGDARGGIFQITQDAPPEDERDAFDERMVRLAVDSGASLALGAVGVTAPRTIKLLERIAAAGGRAFGITHCRGIGSLSSFATQLPFDVLPEWAQLRSLPATEQQRLLRDPDIRAQLVRAAHTGPYRDAVGAEARRPEFDRMRVLDRPVPPNPTVAEVAAARGVDPVEAMIDLALGRFDTFFAQTFTPYDGDALEAAMRHPRTVTGFSDAGAHVSQMSDCSLPTHLLAYWVRQRQVFSFEEAIRMLTLEPARAWEFHDRGLIRVGMAADLNVIDPETVSPELPTVAHDLPAAQPRLKQQATGIRATVVAGQIVHDRGEHTGALPGRLLRRR